MAPVLISAAELTAALRSAAPPVVLDCGFDLADTAAGERAYAAGHLPGAVFAHLDRDFCGPMTGHNGRHPLPSREALAATLGRFGIAPGRAVVTYDAQGSVYAAHAWWLLRWMGHAEVSVLDGGLQAWKAAGGEVETAVPATAPLPPYPARPPGMPVVDVAAVLADLEARPRRWRLLDARSGERYRGEAEPIDPVAGHIPGAAHRFFKDNLAADGRYKPAAELRAAFERWSAAGPVAHYCGSGVTACHNLLAMEHAGLGGSALYPGSWSEWCSDPARPLARGAEG